MTVHLVAAPRSGAALMCAVLGRDPTWDVTWVPERYRQIREIADQQPDAQFVIMTRHPQLTVASAMAAWSSGRFVTEPDLPGWWGDPWSFPLIPDWRDLIGAPLGQVCAAQWAAITDQVWADLGEVAAGRWTVASMEALLADPAAEVDRVAAAWRRPWRGQLGNQLPVTATAVTVPDCGAWRHTAPEAAAGLATVQASVARLETRLRRHRPDVEWEPLSAVPQRPEPVTQASAETPFSSEHSTSLVQLLRQAGVSLAVSTYKSGHLIIGRAGELLDTEFASFDRPMGIAVSGTRLALGTGQAIHILAAQPGLADRVAAAGRFDVGYAPRSITYTGDVAIHDMAYAADGTLFFVNTLFSCLCRHDPEVSFEPIWQPPWISALAGEDRCHLNGLALVDGKPRYVTALATTDTPGGWRDRRGTGGVIVDVTDDRLVATDLAMPHSPRWHDDRLWVLQSGTGELASVDVSTGVVTAIATLPGFPRGLAFLGPYALVGLSQVRESVFADLPITATAAERNCGVWVVDTRSGQIVGLWRFAGVVQELFDVALLPTRAPTLVPAGELTTGAYVVSPQTLGRVGGTKATESPVTG